MAMELYHAVERYRGENADVEMFSRFMNETYSMDDLDVFVSARMKVVDEKGHPPDTLEAEESLSKLVLGSGSLLFVSICHPHLLT